MRLPRVALFVALLLCLGATARAQGSLQVALKVGQPVAMDGLPNVGYFILTRGSVVFHYVPDSGNLRFSNRFENLQYGESVDITFAQAGGQNSVLITSWSNNLHLGYIARYDPWGRLLHPVWVTRKVPVGIDFDYTSGYAYYATADSNEIYRLNVLGGQPERVCEIKDAQRLGSVALHPGHALYIADSDKGTISRLDLSSNQVTVIASNLLQPAALRFDEQQNVLYVADALIHRVLGINTLRPQGGTFEAVPEKLANPSGLAPGFNGALLISDFEWNGVLQATPDLSRINMRQLNRMQVPRQQLPR